ncbi:Tetraacyldisaccharide 4'-kinase [Pseudoalteromonas sp. P1-13-1a]|uniref:tetraacyldisaccharide 4'-kinase n=1 Tax=Pseudoalteromonas sp. P1-13-1a TaxID=1723756 RepID=UPI0006D652D4|nr:tetraacyldisaccharide 4'-kinase [Pseudoalteromonas sp. P1-13-1a]KPZ54691.1 Tetraacyldisaccharide 4'-kinase [Pseudoalteromonas sp. P1-13-1a]
MSKIEQSWYKPFGFITLLLLPLAALFWLIASIRKGFYQCGIAKSFKAKSKVIVVGNISVGGNGKTPFVLWLYEYLSEQGLKVGIISRGYGGKVKSYPLVVERGVTSAQAGDEPILLFNRLKCPLVVGPDREANITLLEQQFCVDVIISDDGMQHYKMARDIECCIVDSQRQFGNGFVMPAGPLRETKHRLNSVDLVIENGGGAPHSYVLKTSGLRHVADNTPVNKTIEQGHAVSAIGNPKRFENTLEDQNIQLLSTHHFRDHYAYSLADFTQFNDDSVLMTEKDAVKCRDFAKDNWYYLPVNAKPTDAVIHKLDLLLKQKGILNGL